MIPRTFPSIIEAFQTKMVVYVLPSITGLTAWIDYIPVKGVVTESATLANTYANGGYQVVKSLDSLTGLQAWIGYIPVYEDASYNKPWSTDAGGYVPVGGLFSILSLFASGAPGVWYDPSDLTTLFQDSAGTTPVTAVEQPVGLMLDKSQGLVLGPELVTNGDFSSGTGWTPAYGTAISGGAAVFDGVTSWPTADMGLRQTSLGAVTGKYYKISFTLLGATTLPIRVGFWTSSTSILAQAAGSYSGIIYNDGSSSGALFIWAAGAGARTGSIDNISVKEIQGNHAFQATSASRPVLSARYNLLTKTEQFTNSYWNQLFNNGLLDNQATAPNGTQTAALFTSRNNSLDRVALNTSITLAPSTAHKISVYVKAVNAGDVGKKQSIYAFNAGFLGVNSFTLTSGWQEVSTTFTNPASGTTFIVVAGCETGTNDACSMYVWGASLVPANQSTLPYQRVNTATDYATTGFLPYLKFDGVDDSLSTNSISFTATDKMSVFAGVRKLSDAAVGIVAESSANSTLSNGSFNLSAPGDAATARYSTALRGTVLAYGGVQTFTAPITNVATQLLNIGATGVTSEIVMRVNGVAGTLVNASPNDAGTGNFGDWPLYIGRRNNATSPFNGQLYSMIIVGKAVTAGELSSTETYVNQKTGAY